MKRGFTLIELMAVIVVLGVIATISVIAVDKIIKENKENAYKAQIATIEDAARTWGVKNIKELPDNDGEAISVPLLYFKNDGIISKDFKNPKTNKPFNDDLYVNISYEGGIYKYEVAEESGLGLIPNPKLLSEKYDASQLILCESVAVSTTGNIPTGKFAPGDEYKCDLGDGEERIFFVLETNGDEVSLIMNANIDSNGKSITPSNIPSDKGTVSWSDDENNHKDDDETKQGVVAKSALKERTVGWGKLNQEQIMLPTKDQVYKAAGNKNSGLPTWMCDYMDSTIHSIPGLYGYWTSTPHESNSSASWYITHDSNNIIATGNVFVSTSRGIRPVIKISKLQIKNSESTTLCKAVTTATTGNVPSGTYAYGDEYTCDLGDGEEKTFFVLETNGDNVSLIMNANIDSNGKAITSSDATDKGLVAWSEDGNNYIDEGESAQAVTAKAYLSSSTAGWTKLNQSQIKLPTPSQIATASGKTFDGSNVVSDLKAWLYNYLKNTTNVVSNVYGYWTTLPFAESSGLAWSVNYSGNVIEGDVSDSGYGGVRPVITISKSQLQ